MLIKAKFTLLTLAPFLFLGLTNAAIAAKDKLQVIRSGTVNSSEATTFCMVNNTTYASIDTTITIFRQQFTPDEPPGEIADHQIPVSIPPGEIRFNFIESQPGFFALSYCTVSWDGLPGELRGTLCSYFTSLEDGIVESNCSELY